MKNFKNILDIERKYDQIVNTARKNYEKELSELKSNLRLKEEAAMEDYKKELDKEFKKKGLSFKEKGSKVFEEAQRKAEEIKEQANKGKAVSFIVEAVKNV